MDEIHPAVTGGIVGFSMGFGVMALFAALFSGVTWLPLYGFWPVSEPVAYAVMGALCVGFAVLIHFAAQESESYKAVDSDVVHSE